MSKPHDITREITFKTARSGGKGGQNVNKVETMVEASFHVENSQLTPEEKAMIIHRLKNRINSEGMLQVRSQAHRSQLSNKMEVIKKMNGLVARALIREKKRIPTKPSKASRVKRLESKKHHAESKSARQKIRIG